ncbi:cilia- and flagella-associated protein 90-like [Oscarella lobularis]|uniref:cilia- and flagella-associated protein 90-like n=1 Tax=Oscarella lobularis TaxID=121494 RepID=UPI0033143D56
MAYPGEGYNMSNYGSKWYTPEQTKEQWRRACHRERALAEKHAMSSERMGIVAQKSNEKSTDCLKETSYFNTEKLHKTESTYDRMFHVKEGYNSKLHRDDREHTQNLDVHSEEKQKFVPTLSSSVYGHRSALENVHRLHGRVALVQRDFYRAGGTNIPLGGYGSQ